MKYKTTKIQTEFGQLPSHNPKLMRLLHVIDEFTALELNKEITLTEIYRTPEEQAQLYSQTPPDKRPATSPHMTWGAADLRASDFTVAEKSKMVAFILNFKNQNGKPSALLHTIVGNVEHFHIAYGA